MPLEAMGRADSSRRRDRSDDRVALLASHAAIPWAIGAGFVLVGLVAIRANTFLNDEGVLTWILAGLMSESPIDMLFLMKARPPISALYAPAAAFGLIPFLWAHVLVAALAIPLTASLARHFGHRYPNFPAALVALSPLYFASAAGGVQNTEAVVGLLVVAWLLARDQSMAAGLVAGAVVLGRIETAVFALALAAYAALTPNRRRFLVGIVVLPAGLTLFGAFYHGHLLWPLLYPSTLSSNAAIAPGEMGGPYGGNLDDLATTLLAFTPVVGAILWTRFRDRSSLENILTLAAITFVVILRLLPFTHLINIDDTPRYVLPAVPFLCLAVSGAIDTWGTNTRGSVLRLALLLGLAAVGAAFLEQRAMSLLLGAVTGCVVAFGIASRSPSGSVAALLATAALGALPLLPNTRLVLGGQAGVLDDMTSWLEAAHIPSGGVVVTDYSLLGIWLSQHAPDLKIDLRFLWPPDMRYEVETLTNPATRQLEVFSNTSRFFYARWLLVDEIAALPGDVYFVLRVENSRRKDLAEPPLSQVEWLVEGTWRGGRLSQASRAAAGRPNTP